MLTLLAAEYSPTRCHPVHSGERKRETGHDWEGKGRIVPVRARGWDATLESEIGGGDGRFAWFLTSRQVSEPNAGALHTSTSKCAVCGFYSVVKHNCTAAAHRSVGTLNGFDFPDDDAIVLRVHRF